MQFTCSAVHSVNFSGSSMLSYVFRKKKHFFQHILYVNYIKYIKCIIDQRLMGIETQENADNYSECTESQIKYEKAQKTGCLRVFSRKFRAIRTTIKVSYVARIFTKHKAERYQQNRKSTEFIWDYLEWTVLGNFGMQRVRKRCLRAQNGKSIKLNVKCIHSHKNLFRNVILFLLFSFDSIARKIFWSK